MSASAWSAAEIDALERDARVPILRSPAARRAASGDFGGLSRGAAAAVALPRSADDVVSVLAFASRHGLRVTPRGLGLSQSGQAIAPAGVLALDLTRLDFVGDVQVDSKGQARVTCGAGARFREVAGRAREYGMLPCVTPLNLDLTVGGVLSVGGVGTTGHNFGPLVANVPEVVAITGAGERVRASRAERPEVLDAVLAGLGRAAIVCDATLTLRPALPRVTTFQLLYADIAVFLRDQRRIALGERQRRPEHVEGFIASSPFAPAAPLFVLQAGYEHAHDEAPREGDVLEGLTPWRTTRAPEADTFAYASRFDPRFEAMVRSGAWDLAHPWVEAFLPAEALADVLPRALAELPPSVGDGHRTLLFRNDRLPPFFAVPDTASGELAAFAILPVGVPVGARDDVLAALGRVDALLRAAGGKRYVSGWLGAMDDAAWSAHYGARYLQWREAKRTLDPGGVLTSALF